MELRHLRYFLAVAHEGHFGRAASHLHIGQPTLSEQIRALEREVGGPLLVRASGGATLTEAGKLLLPEAERVVDQAGHAARIVRQSIQGDLGSVRVGFSGVAVLSGLLGSDLRTFHNAHPLVDIELTELSPRKLGEALREGTIDIAYGPNILEDESVRFFQRAHIPLVIAVHDAHPLATASNVRISDLSGETLLAFTEDAIEVPMDLAHLTEPGRIQSVASTLGVLALAAAGVGVAIVPAATQLIPLPGLIYRTLEGAAGLAVTVAGRANETGGPVRTLFAMLLQLATPDIETKK